MNLRTTLALSLLMLCVCVPQFVAQRRNGRAVKPPRPTAVPPSTTQPTWTILTEHYTEDGANTTMVKLEPMPLDAGTDKKATAQLTANFTYEDSPIAAPKYVALTFMSQAGVCRFRPQANLQLLFDGKPLTLSYQADSTRGEGVWWVMQEAEESGKGCTESVGAFLAPQTLRKLVAAQAVTAKLGGADAPRLPAPVFALSAIHLSALRDLASRIPPAANPK